MIKDFYIRYGAKSSKIIMSFKHDKIKLFLYVRSIGEFSKYIVVKNRDILFESPLLEQALRYYRNQVFLTIPEYPLFNN